MFEGFLVIGRLQMPREITSMSIVGQKKSRGEAQQAQEREYT